MNRLKTHEEDIEIAGKHDNIRGNRKSTGKCKDTVKENVPEEMVTTRMKGAKSVGTWRKPERLLGTMLNMEK